MKAKFVDLSGTCRLLLAAGCLLVGLAVGALPAQASPQGEEELCLECHADPEMFEGVEDAARYLVDPQVYATSVHGEQELFCIDCHLNREDIPHTGPPEAVLCGDCHDDQADDHARSLHGQAAARGDPLAPTCANCHGNHDILSHTDRRSRTRVMNIPFLCGECHHEGTAVSRTRDIPQDRILENYSLSIHGEGLYRQGLTVTAVCTSCHTSHLILPHTDPESSIHRDAVAGHLHAVPRADRGGAPPGHRGAGSGSRRPTSSRPASTAIRRTASAGSTTRPGPPPKTAWTATPTPDLTGTSQGVVVSLYVDAEAHNTSAHSSVACAQCHTEVSTRWGDRARRSTAPVDCAGCHEDQTADYRASVHGRSAVAGRHRTAPACLDCHEKHATQSAVLADLAHLPRNVPELCGHCHRQGEEAAVRIFHEGDVEFTPVESYEMSIHGKGLYESGLLVTATCSELPLGAQDAAGRRSRIDRPRRQRRRHLRNLPPRHRGGVQGPASTGPTER